MCSQLSKVHTTQNSLKTAGGTATNRGATAWAAAVVKVWQGKQTHGTGRHPFCGCRPYVTAGARWCCSSCCWELLPGRGLCGPLRPRVSPQTARLARQSRHRPLPHQDTSEGCFRRRATAPARRHTPPPPSGDRRSRCRQRPRCSQAAAAAGPGAAAAAGAAVVAARTTPCGARCGARRGRPRSLGLRGCRGAAGKLVQPMGAPAPGHMRRGCMHPQRLAKQAGQTAGQAGLLHHISTQARRGGLWRQPLFPRRLCSTEGCTMRQGKGAHLGIVR